MLESDFESLFGESDFEFDEADFGEAARGGRRPPTRPLPTPPHGNAAVNTPAPGYATKAELTATANRLDGRIATVGESVRTLDRRTHSLEREASAISSALKKEIAVRKRETGELKKGLDESRQIAMIMPLLGGGNDKLSKMLPLLMYGGMMGNSDSSSSDSNNSMMMTMMMVLALQP